MNRRTPLLLIAAATVVAVLAALLASRIATPDSVRPSAEASQEPQQVPAESEEASGEPEDGAGSGRPITLERVHARFDPDHPGRGVTDYPGNTVEDIPKSYAMILQAELERGRHGIRKDLPSLERAAGRWLLRNATLNQEGKTGWGNPVPWDAGGDGTVNPAHTIYSITTAIVADALMTWMETSPRAPAKEIIATLTAALDDYARAPRTPDGLLAYSLQPSDRQYDAFNSAAYLAGQMQRFANTYAADPRLAARLSEAADGTVASLVRHRRISPSRSWYWWYTLQDDYSNDMAHASYIVEGLTTYVREGGRFADDVDLPAVVAHLHDFLDDSGKPRGWPHFETRLSFRPRLYDMGMGLHLACSEPGLGEMTEPLTDVLEEYDAGDEGFLMLPDGTPDQPRLVVNEYEAYLWRGLVSCTASGQRTRR